MSPADTDDASTTPDDARVRVAVRVRPFNDREVALDSTSCVRMADTKTTITHPSTGQETTFTFDHSFNSNDNNNNYTNKPATQADVFQKVGHEVLESAWNGYNVCLFAYGQTGSGKSYSMVGGTGDTNMSESQEGIVPRVCREIFSRLTTGTNDSWSVAVTMIEIYDEKVYDLLSDDKSRPSLKVRQHPINGPYVEGLEPIDVMSYSEIKQLMHRGEKNRTVHSTAMNEASSRAHTVFELHVSRVEMSDDTSETKSTHVETKSKIVLVDLAGSERADATEATGQRLKEASAINKSLSALGNCISALAEKSSGKNKKEKLVPYRDSSLTLLLKDCLGGNSRCVLIAAFSPASVNYDETLSTLRFADRARNIISSASVNRESAIPKQVRIHAEAVEQLRDATGDNDSTIDPQLEASLVKAIELTEEANEICADFDVPVVFKPTLVDAQSALLRIRKCDNNSLDTFTSSINQDTHALEVAIDVLWTETGRKNIWPVQSLSSRLNDWEKVREDWREGVLFSDEAKDFVKRSTKMEVTSEMRKLGTAQLSTEPLAYLLDTETLYPGIVGADGTRRGTLEVSAVPCTRDGTPLPESNSTSNPEDLLNKPLYFLVRIKRATGLPRTAIGVDDELDDSNDSKVNDSNIQSSTARKPQPPVRPQTGQVTATLRVRYHGDLGAGWGAVHATPPVPVVAVHESKGSARFRGFRGSSGATTSGAAAVLRYERTHSCPSNTSDVLDSLKKGVITFDVYLQHDGGAGAGASGDGAQQSRPSTADITRLRRKALEVAPPSLLPVKRPPSPVREEPEIHEEDSSDVSDVSDVSDSDSASNSSVSSYSSSQSSRSSYSGSSISDSSFDREAYNRYWDTKEAKHATSLRSSFKMFPGWGAAVSPAPSPAQENKTSSAQNNNGNITFTNDGKNEAPEEYSDDVPFMDEELMGTTTLDTLAARLEATVFGVWSMDETPVGSVIDETPLNSPAPISNPNRAAKASPTGISFTLSSPLKSPLHKGKVAVGGVVEVREKKKEEKREKSSRQPRALASDTENSKSGNPFEVEKQEEIAATPPPPCAPNAFGMASFLRIGRKK